MKEFINKSKESHNYVVLDTPGVAVNNDVMVLSNFVDKTVLKKQSQNLILYDQMYLE